jgi:hypothetical protein
MLWWNTSKRHRVLVGMPAVPPFVQCPQHILRHQVLLPEVTVLASIRAEASSTAASRAATTSADLPIQASA